MADTVARGRVAAVQLLLDLVGLLALAELCALRLDLVVQVALGLSVADQDKVHRHVLLAISHGSFARADDSTGVPQR